VSKVVCQTFSQQSGYTKARYAPANQLSPLGHIQRDDIPRSPRKTLFPEPVPPSQDRMICGALAEST
jgi:hypothetical protein